MTRLLKRYLPTRRTLMRCSSLRLFRQYMCRNYLWAFNQTNVARAGAIGLFVAFIPVPIQMFLAALGAIYFQANLPIAVALVWVSNPVTLPALFYLSYKVGVWLMGDVERIVLGDFEHYLVAIWPPFLLGSFTLAIIAGLLGYGFVIVFWRLLRRKSNGTAA